MPSAVLTEMPTSANSVQQSEADIFEGIPLPGRLVIAAASLALIRAISEPTEDEKKEQQRRQADEEQRRYDELRTAELKHLLNTSPTLTEVHEFAQSVATISDPLERAQLIKEYLGRLAETEITKLKADGETPEEAQLIAEIISEQKKANTQIDDRLERVSLACGNIVRISSECTLESGIRFGDPDTTFKAIGPEIYLTQNTAAIPHPDHADTFTLPDGAQAEINAQVITPGLPPANLNRFPVRLPRNAEVTLI